MPLTATKTTPRLDTYQKLLLDAIRTYGSGDWKNGVSIHHKHDQSMFSNILIGGEVVAKVVYEEAHDDISIEEYEQFTSKKLNLLESVISHLAMISQHIAMTIKLPDIRMF